MMSLAKIYNRSTERAVNELVGYSPISRYLRGYI